MLARRTQRYQKQVAHHGEVVMNAMHRKVEKKSPVLLGQDVINVEQESVESVLEESPDEAPQYPAGKGQRNGGRRRRWWQLTGTNGGE